MTSKPPLRILMLHGYTQSGPLYRSKTRALEKALIKALPNYSISLTYPTAPHRLRPADSPGFFATSTSSFTPNNAPIDTKPNDAEKVVEQTAVAEEQVDSWGWFTRDEHGVYVGLEQTFEEIAELIGRDGPFDGAIGFSQGAAIAVMLGSLLEHGRRAGFEAASDGRESNSSALDYPFEFPRKFITESGMIQSPLRFAVSYSGFRAPLEKYAWFYSPKVSTRTLCVRGSLDTVVSEERGEALEKAMEKLELLVHPGGHFVPSGKRELGAVCGFVREVMATETREGRDDR